MCFSSPLSALRAAALCLLSGVLFSSCVTTPPSGPLGYRLSPDGQTGRIDTGLIYPRYGSAPIAPEPAPLAARTHALARAPQNNWNGYNRYSSTVSVRHSRSSVQCSAYTQKGYRCSRMTTSPNGRCYQHGGN